MKIYLFTGLLLIISHIVHSTSLTDEQLAIKKLDFLIGNWAGEGQSFNEEGLASDYFDTEDVSYDVNQSIVVIRANGYKNEENTYSLHTIIHYDSTLKHYWYRPFTAKGARQYRCDLIEQQLLCLNPSNNFRLTFQRLGNGQWNEFGERLTPDGRWIKTFETKLNPIQTN